MLIFSFSGLVTSFLLLSLRENLNVDGQMHQERHSSSDDAYSTKCNSSQLSNIIKARPSFNSNCPDKTNWMNIVLNESKSNEKATIVVIGCNKGDDFISQLGAWSGNTSYDPVKYVEKMQEKYQGLNFICKAAKRIAFDQVPRMITGYCIEPLPVNFNLLTRMMNVLNFDTSFVKVLPLAFSLFPDVGQFPDVVELGQAGAEYFGLGSVKKN
jgi:hypothetical protein